ncbi:MULTISPECIES: hypothetical protein [unclassified Rhizobium]|uniref:hypothetical protein n=1 Tax=unclassified Rhizobium TaxID=2613769 RepID=UPI0006F55F7A|nr:MULTISPECIES: hypothetical protein [unclassified Rhizobium]KQV38334.1 hypothetical protein ASC86_08940 [Rhizobium sp. Root1212]KRD30989.1 hypothetical protein ASE37_08930 [Rhizobium sp. Root268]
MTLLSRLLYLLPAAKKKPELAYNAPDENLCKAYSINLRCMADGRRRHFPASAKACAVSVDSLIFGVPLGNTFAYKPLLAF